MAKTRDEKIELTLEKAEGLVVRELLEAKRLVSDASRNMREMVISVRKTGFANFQTAEINLFQTAERIVLNLARYDEQMVGMAGRLLRDFAAAKGSKKYGKLLSMETGRVIGTLKHFKPRLQSIAKQMAVMASLTREELVRTKYSTESDPYIAVLHNYSLI